MHTALQPAWTTQSVYQIASTLCFSAAILHTFLAGKISNIAKKFPVESLQEKIFHFLSEVEIVFGFWTAVFLSFVSIKLGLKEAAEYLESVNITEPVFVFCIMCIASTRPILDLTLSIMQLIAKLFTKMCVNQNIAMYCTILILGPLMGSFITEPAAITVSAMLLLRFMNNPHVSNKFRYASLGLLFVNVSIGGVLTNYAAPLVVVVAQKWNLTSAIMFQYFGWKAALATLISTLSCCWYFRKEIIGIPSFEKQAHQKVPLWMSIIHIGFMLLSILCSHYIVFLIGLFLFFVGWYEASKKYQSTLRIRESLLVAFFLAGLIALGSMQSWWLKEFLTKLSEYTIFIGATALTAVTDNAALTYLGSLVPNLSEHAKYFLLAGAITGGGLTIIANAPNPAGYGILKHAFPEHKISHLYLFLGALPFTLIAAFIFGFFRQ